LIFLTAISFIAFILITGYSFLIRHYQDLFMKIPPFIAQKPVPENVTVIIPARNEEKNIGPCLDAILNQDYPGSYTEIIVADDQSNDNTSSVVQSKGVRLISMNNLPEGTVAFKKAALTAAIAASSGETIITTDADCIAPPDWLSTLIAVKQSTGAVLVAAPVRMRYGRSFLSKFQSLDFAILQGITAASLSGGFHSMGNGANLAYTKDAFNSVGGFTGVDDIASGDDMLLMHKISVKYPAKTAYAFSPDAIVETNPEPDWKSFFRQRIRWASKARKYEDKRIFRVLLMVYLLNLFMLVLMCMSFFSITHFGLFLLMLLYKTGVEWGFVKQVLKFFELQKLMRWFPVAQPFHITYTVISGLFGQSGSYQWKGRQVK
jgi:cellulose synthase/poly-beta-1,6-N-acetylglucosamine synthase-like glycosyltransferase